MRFRCVLIVGILPLAAASTHAASPFNGTWKSDDASMKTSGPADRFMVSGGDYACLSCHPSFTVKADGAFHPVKGYDWTDESSVKIVDGRTLVMVDRKGGKVMEEERKAVSADGATMTVTGTDRSGPKGEPVIAETHYRRVAAAPAGAHAVSGSWRMVSGRSSENGQLMTATDTGDSFALSLPTGHSYKARFGGPFVPMAGDPAGTRVKVERKGPRAILQTLETASGKPTATFLLTVAADGRSMHILMTDLRDGSRTTETMIKQ